MLSQCPTLKNIMDSSLSGECKKLEFLGTWHKFWVFGSHTQKKFKHFGQQSFDLDMGQHKKTCSFKNILYVVGNKWKKKKYFSNEISLQFHYKVVHSTNPLLRNPCCFRCQYLTWSNPQIIECFWTPTYLWSVLLI